MWFDCSEERSVEGTGPWALVQPGQNCTVCCISAALSLYTCCLLSMESKEAIYEIYIQRNWGRTPDRSYPVHVFLHTNNSPFYFSTLGNPLSHHQL